MAGDEPDNAKAGKNLEEQFQEAKAVVGLNHRHKC